MNTIEDRLEQGASDVHVAVASLQEGAAPRTRRRTVPAVAFAAGVLAVLLIGLPLIVFRGDSAQPGSPTSPGATQPQEVATIPGGDDGTHTLTTEPTAPSSTAEKIEVDAPRVTVTEVSTGDVPPIDSTPLIDGDAFRSVSDLLATTGQTYAEFPDFIPDAAVSDGRAVIVGGNATRTAGIWFSDGGAWTPAEIEFPEGMAIGEAPGDYRLADGIQNVKATSDGFVAWEPVQFVDGSDPRHVGTLIFASVGGATWTVTLIEEQLVDLIEWQDGHLAVVSEPGMSATSKAKWSEDLDTWIDIADLGEGYAYEVIEQDGSVAVGLWVSETETNDDGSLSIVGETVRRVSIDPAGR